MMSASDTVKENTKECVCQRHPYVNRVMMLISKQQLNHKNRSGYSKTCLMRFLNAALSNVRTILCQQSVFLVKIWVNLAKRGKESSGFTSWLSNKIKIQ
jgi:hypothetical protein